MFFLIFGCTFIFYIFSMYPTISPYRDSGDMIVSAFTLGIAHPPGYPLYVLLGKIFIVLFPLGNIAYRINLMSAFFGALACGILYLLIKRLCIESISMADKPRYLSIAPAVAVVLFAFTSAMHSLSIVSEMYSINIFFAVLVMYILFFPRYFSPAGRLLAVFILGLGMGNHQTLILLIPGIIYLIIRNKNNNLLNLSGIRYLSYIICIFMLGLFVYLFLPVRSARNPVADWGSPAKSFRNFARVFTRADYGAVRLHPEKSPSHQNIAVAARHFVDFLKISVEGNRFLVILIICFLLFGMQFSFKKSFFWPLFLFWFFSGPFFFIISNLPLEDKTSLPILEPYLIMPLAVFSIWIGLGILYIHCKLIKFVNNEIVLILAAGIVILGIFRAPELNKRYEFIAYDYSKDLLKTLPYNSVLFNPDDTTTFTLKYQQECLGKRKDIKLAVFYKTLWGYQQIKERYPEILPNYEIKGGIELEKTLLSYNFNRIPFYTDNIVKIPKQYKIFPKGLLYGNSGIFEQMFDFYIKMRTSGKERFFTHQIINYYSAGYNNSGLAFNEKKLYNKSIRLFEKAIAIDPSLSQAYNNLGVVYWEKGDYKKAADYFREALKYVPSDTGVKGNLQMAEEKIK
ncbi:MAG: DUF2723 domain-containing protein [Elusimicrobia bacterium]|nr:DUF2723 domain-containing protein [Elusimicrobiota bacterium]